MHYVLADAAEVYWRECALIRDLRHISAHACADIL
jgi:hypothetical protein